jgi:flagellar hook-basal body protein
MGSAYDLTAVSGINAASKGLGVISNNLANAQTVGFKSSRAEFSDMFYGAQNSPGNGVRVQSITQNFTNGTINDTGRDLDMGIDGEGFFVLEDKTGRFENVYSRNGSFKLDKDGYLTSQNGNKVQGYLLNEELSSETNPVFYTTLNSIDMDELNKRPRPTDEMTFDINLNGQEDSNYDPDGDDIQQVISDVTRDSGDAIYNFLVTPASQGGFSTTAMTNAEARSTANGLLSGFDLGSVVNGTGSVGSAIQAASQAIDALGNGITNGGGTASIGEAIAGSTAGRWGAKIMNSGYNSMVTNVNNMLKLTNPEQNGEYGGFPDFTTNKIIHDTLGGEHRVTTNFYKRDVVEGSSPSNDLNEKYTSWMVQYTVEDFNQETGEWETSGHRVDDAGNPTDDAGQVFEMRFDTNGDLIDMRQPTTAAPDLDNPIYSKNILNDTSVIGPGEALQSATNVNPGWVSIGRSSPIEFVIDAPLTGAQDPLGSENVQQRISLDADFTEMTQFAGDYNLRGVTQNGYNVGDLVGVTTSLDGVIEARYSNGRSVPIAQVALANVNDKNAMEKLGGQTYAETFSSGAVQLGTPQNNGFGTVNAGTLEYSNVDTAGELVNMIQTQRTYQASAQVIQTSQTLTQTILQL